MEKILPVKHLSARVPWHDNKWNGSTCRNVLDNSFCRILTRIDAEKDPDKEPSNVRIMDGAFPPCIHEKGTFLSRHEYIRKLTHAWSGFNPMFMGYGACTYHHKPYSLNAIPFLWMMKNKASDKEPHLSEKARVYELDYDPDLEAEVDGQLGFSNNIWVQHSHNQEQLLNAFFGCLRKGQSLIFFYCKHTPLTEPNERVIVGVAKVRKEVGNILEYSYPEVYEGHRSYPWDRCVEHTLTDDNPDGFLLPYHEILDYVKENNLEVELREYATLAPDFLQFSYASELVEHDTAIDALLGMAESLRKSSALLGKSFKKEIDWVDYEISKIWDMRGAFPGMGPVLSALGINSGNTIAWEIERHILQEDGDLLSTNPWEIFEESMVQPDKYLKERGRSLFTKTTQTKWRSKPARKKQFYYLLSRCQMNNAQASFVIDNHDNCIGTIEEIMNNPYLLYERPRLKLNGLSFRQIDKALLPPEKIRRAFNLPEMVVIEDNLDERRVRALSVWALEEAAAEGHSVLSFSDLLDRLKQKRLDETFPIDEDVLTAQSEADFFTEEVHSILPSKENKTHFLKLQRLLEIKNIIRQRINLKQIINRPFNIEKDWLSLINDHPEFSTPDPKSADFEEELLARREKAEALSVLTNYRFSVLIGPAGSGKTTLLEIFEKLPEIQRGGILKLAPTGKARVKLGHSAKTIAQFLFPERYDGSTSNYFPNEAAGKTSAYKNIIVDEASMLTEEQLAALFDALGPVDRIILVGDYRQLPPIGTGRPFVDITQHIKPATFKTDWLEIDGRNIEFTVFAGPAYAELTKIRRQAERGDVRWDVLLSKCFSDNPSKEDLEVFHSLASGVTTSSYIRFLKWYESADFRELFRQVLEEELSLDKSDLIKSFNLTIGGKEKGGYVYFDCGYAEREIEKWQIISPVNGFGYGVKEVNKFIQTTYRKPYINLALNVKPDWAEYYPKRRVAKPKGSDNIIYGDKVINLKNTRWYEKQWVKPQQKKPSALNYIANGEIGIITGEFRAKTSTFKGEPSVDVAFSTQPGYSYVFRPDQLGEDSRYSLELAYAITVHKAQGSGFKKVFFILPSKGAILSRELLYTALTRQEDRIIILHQGDFREFIRLASTDASATARRFTDLFHLPEVKQLNKKWYDARYVNISERGEPMLSKSEVIIANSLNKYKTRITYAYENKLKLENFGLPIKPDFTIDNIETSKRFYWEHLGMMARTAYREKWQKKLEGYLADGFVPHNQAKISDERVLIVTEDNPNGGIDSRHIEHLIRSIILEEDTLNH